ncbi:MAG: hypothetical protein KDB68_01290 [Planctomycetes bacterium]|nr:hypothetical protein [Planctomycetota bacterium]MCA8934813.1 hypothetical protein [Planctomycetota bacterium]MCA8946168.1 hypothetical protein [Planctomycetota bacterium]
MSTKKTSLVVLLLGLAVMVFTLVDPTFMGSTPAGGSEGFGSEGALGEWPVLRIAVLSAGALLGVLGAYGLTRKSDKKK